MYVRITCILYNVVKPVLKVSFDDTESISLIEHYYFGPTNVKVSNVL